MVAEALGPGLLLDAEDADVLLADAVGARPSLDPTAAAHLCFFFVCCSEGGGCSLWVFSYPVARTVNVVSEGGRAERHGAWLECFTLARHLGLFEVNGDETAAPLQEQTSQRLDQTFCRV